MIDLNENYNSIISHNKTKTRSLILAISSQNNLNSAIAHKDPKADPNCELCGTKQNSEHVLLDCPELDALRQKLDYGNARDNITGEDKIHLNKFTKLVVQSRKFK